MATKDPNTDKPLIEQAVELEGITAIASACGVSYQAVQRWVAKNRMPRTEWTCETRYALAIEEITEGSVPAHKLCPGAYPVPEMNGEAVDAA